MESYEKLNELDRRVDSVTTSVKNLERDVTEMEHSVTSLKVNQVKFETDIVIVKKDLEYQSRAMASIETTINNMDSKLDRMKDANYDDHYKTPLDKYNRLGWLILGLLLSAGFSFLTKLLGG